MNSELSELVKVIKEMQVPIEKDITMISEIISRFTRFLRNVYSDRKTHVSGEQMKLCLEDAFSISIILFAMIDKDTEGLDDKLSSEFEKLKIRYLGQ